MARPQWSDAEYEALIARLVAKCARLQGVPVEHEQLNWVLPGAVPVSVNAMRGRDG